MYIIIIPLARALEATLRLVTNRQAVRSMPWSYLWRLTRDDRWMGFAVAMLGVSVVCILATIAAPLAQAGGPCAVGFIAASLGVASSWIRGLFRAVRR